MDDRDQMMYAIGCESLGSNLLLLSIPMSQASNHSIVVHVLKRLKDLHYGDECRIALSEALSRGDKGRGRYIIIAALVSGNRRAIYQVDIPDSTH